MIQLSGGDGGRIQTYTIARVATAAPLPIDAVAMVGVDGRPDGQQQM